MGNSAKCVVQSVILVINGCCSKCNFAYMKTKIILAALLVVGVLSGKTEKKMNETLNQKQQVLVAVAACEAKDDQKTLERILDDAFERGVLTVNEAKEALSQLYAYTGFPRSLNALASLQKVVAERRKKGGSVEVGSDASPLPDDYDALKQGTEVQTRMSGKPFDYAFAPAVDYYLKAHLFGDIFARDVLTYSEREIVTVAALSAIDGVEPQLKAHVAGARRMGVTDRQLRAIPEVLEQKVGRMEAFRAAKAVAEEFGEVFVEGRPIEHQMFPTGEPNTEYAKYFIGNSYIAPLLSEGLPVSNVAFEPRCRNNWHVHHRGAQVLICVGGEGWYQEWGKPARRLHQGDVVNIPAEVKHWHGAAADSWFQHIAIAVPADGASNEWLEPVTDEEYDKLR